MNISNPGPQVIEKNVPLSKSTIWNTQKNFFIHNGIDAWRNGPVPQYITNNSFIARYYANIIDEYLLYLESLTSYVITEPVMILELGAGTGKFAYLFLETFLSIRRSSIPFCYVLTDISIKNLSYWQNHAGLRKYFAQNLIDIGLLDLDHQDNLVLQNSGLIINHSRPTEQLLIIGNYFLDSIPSDGFKIHKGRLYEGLFSVKTKNTNTEHTNNNFKNTPDNFSFEINHQACSEKYYKDPLFNTILEEYTSGLEHSNILFPITAMRYINQLKSWSKHGLFMLFGDKGPLSIDDLDQTNHQKIAVHGSISHPVNFHCLGRYVQLQNGSYQYQHTPNTTFNVVNLLYSNSKETSSFQSETLKSCPHSPGTYIAEKAKLSQQLSSANLDEIIGLLELSGWDTGLFLHCFYRITELIPEGTDAQKQAIDKNIGLIIQNHFEIEHEDIFFKTGCIAMFLEDKKRAFDLLQESVKHTGPNAVKYFNMALCMAELGDFEQAKELALLAKNLNPEVTEITQLIHQLTKELT